MSFSPPGQTRPQQDRTALSHARDSPAHRTAFPVQWANRPLDSGLRIAHAQQRLRRHPEVPLLVACRHGWSRKAARVSPRPHEFEKSTEVLEWKHFRKLIPMRLKLKTSCRNPGSNQGPLDLQSNALPTELFRHCGECVLDYAIS